MIIRILINLLLIYAAWQLIKFIFRIALVYWLKRNAGKMFQFNGKFGHGFNKEPQRPVGDIRVENAGSSRGRQSPDLSKGEYIDFEEIK